MSTSREDRNATIVVGIDGSEVAYAALDWALDEAGRRDAEVVGVLASGGAIGPTPLVPMMNDWPDEAARALLAAAESHAATRASATTFRTVTSLSGAAAALLHASEQADLVVVGGRRHRRLGELLLGATAPQVAAHASCPVVVVPAGTQPEDDRPVVVGVDGSTSGRAALEFAFAHAAETGRPLVALHAWWLGVPDTAGRSTLSSDVIIPTEQDHRALADDALRPFTTEYPRVPVEQVVVRADPVDALLEAGEKAGLVVVGSRGHGGFAGLLLGSVSQGVLHARLTCPVAVVHSAVQAEDGSAD
jgi:nucleotide-binding universal stress UspA family protein